jgi:hypothetical protein
MLMINNVIEINNKNDEDIIITQIEHIIEYLNYLDYESDIIEKELEENIKKRLIILKYLTTLTDSINALQQ